MWDNYDNDNDSSQIILGRQNKLGWRNSFSDWWWVIEWDFPELHHIIVCENFVRFAHCLCTSHFSRVAAAAATATQCSPPPSVQTPRETHYCIYVKNSLLWSQFFLWILLLCNNNKKVFECCLESSRYICVKSLWHPQFPFSFHHSHFWNLFFSWQICDGLNTCACQKVHTYDYAPNEIFLNHWNIFFLNHRYIY